MARYRFRQDEHEVQIKVDLDGFEVQYDGRIVPEEDLEIDHSESFFQHAGEFRLSQSGPPCTYGWKCETVGGGLFSSGTRQHTVWCNGEIVLQVEVDADGQ